MSARWRLKGKHYINVIPTNGQEAIEWEYKETDRTTGKSGRKLFAVPAYLDPDDPSLCNYPGEIIVADKEDRAHPRDIIFFGEPTPDMEPINEEADKISESLAAKWQHPIEGLPTNGNYSQSLLTGLEKQLAALIAKNPISPAQPVSENQVSKEDFDALQAKVQALMEQNASLMAKLPKAEKRV